MTNPTASWNGELIAPGESAGLIAIKPRRANLIGSITDVAELDDGVAALVSWKENQIVFVIPAVNGAGAIYKQGQTVQVGVLLQGDNASAASNTVPYTF